MKSQESHRYRRIVVKAGTNVLTGGGDSLDYEVIASLVEQIAEVHGSGEWRLRSGDVGRRGCRQDTP